MAVGITNDTFSESPYITPEEYKNAPTSIDYDNLVVGGNAQAQDAELHNVILRASSYMNEYFNANLNATQYIETQRTRFTSNTGFIALHPNNSPIISLVNFQYGTNPNDLVTLGDCSISWFEEQQIIIPLSNVASTWSSQGPLQFGGYGLPRQQVYCKYTYVAGYVNNPIVSAVQGESELVVANATGIVPNQRLRIYDGHKSESVVVSDNYVYGSTTVLIDTPLLYDHAPDVTLGNIPNVLKEACILLTTAFLKVRGDSSLTMQVTSYPSGNPTSNPQFGNDIALALDMVNKYRRIR